MASEQPITILQNSVLYEELYSFTASFIWPSSSRFFQNVGEEYGISNDDPISSTEMESITIPEGRYTLAHTNFD